jgi:hypothetical protein
MKCKEPSGDGSSTCAACLRRLAIITRQAAPARNAALRALSAHMPPHRVVETPDSPVQAADFVKAAGLRLVRTMRLSRTCL